MPKFKTPQIESEYQALRDDVKRVLRVVEAYLAGCGNGDEVEITSIKPEEGIERISTSHQDGRAADVSTKRWPDNLAETVALYVNRHYTTGLFFSNDKPMLVAVYHDSGYGKHIHFQGPANGLITVREKGEEQ